MDATGEPAVKSRFGRLRPWVPLIALGVVVLIVYALVVPRMGSVGTVRSGTLELDRGQPLPGVDKSRRTLRNVYGFVALPFSRAKVSFDLPRTFPVEGDTSI